jgi:nitroreductase
MLKDLIVKNRSYRRFHQDQAIERATLLELVELATLSASAANRQPLKYALSCDPQTNTLIFPCLAWAGYLEDWPAPAPGERPAAYIVILADRHVCDHVDCDHGIAAQSILLGAAERGLGGCMVGSIQRKALHQALELPGHCDILLVIALGSPSERVVLEQVKENGDIRYWRDRDGTHHVPKRRVEDVVLR